MGFIVGLMGIMGLWKASGFLLWPPLLILIYPYISGYPEGVPRSGAVSRGDRPGWRAVPPGGAAHSRQPRADGGLAQAQGERLRQEQGGQTNGYKQRSHKIHFLRFRGMLNVFLFKMFSWAKCGGLLLDGAGKKVSSAHGLSPVDQWNQILLKLFYQTVYLESIIKIY